MGKQNATFSLEDSTITAIKKIASDTRRKKSAIVDLAIEHYAAWVETTSNTNKDNNKEHKLNDSRSQR